MTDVSQRTTLQRRGLVVLSSLRAEDEPWLVDCFVQSAEFAPMAGARNALILGETGSGKTALRLLLERAWLDLDVNSAAWLLVHWRFNALLGVSESLSGSPLAAQHQRQLLDEIARALLMHLGQQPARWSTAPAWVSATLSWFIERFLAGDAQINVESLVADGQLPVEALALLSEIGAARDSDVLSADASPTTVMAELARTLPHIGLAGVRILMADVEPWWEAYPRQIFESLEALLSTLALFEHPAFAFTFFLPAIMWPRLSRTPAVARRRVQVFQLRYHEPELVRIVERRLALAFGRTEAALSDLGPAEDLTVWLNRCGGVSPRGWLETMRPFLAAYLARQNNTLPLTKKECRAVQVWNPPVLWLEPNASRVTVGWRQVTELSPGHVSLLRRLSDHAGEICSRKDLYKAYQQAYDGEYDERDIKSSDITGVLDSALWRLRRAIEPIPEKPVLLETKRGQGMRLRCPARDWRE